MTDWWLQDRVVTPVGSAAAPNWWDSDPVKNAEPQKSVVRDVIEQFPQGFNRGIDALYNLPNNAVNFAAKQMGYEPPITPVKLATRFNNEDDTPKTTAGRYAGATGEALGASVLPMAGTVARGAEAAPALWNTLTSSLGAGTAGEAAKDAGAGPGWQAAASILGGQIAPGAINSALAKGPPDPRMIEKTMAAKAAQDENITVPRAAVAGSVEKPLAGRLAALPVVGAPLQNSARSSLDQTANRLTEIADAYGTGNRASTGQGIKDSIVDYISKGSKKPVSRMYDAVDNAVNPTIATPPAALQRAVQDLRAAPSLAEQAINEKAIKLIEDDIAKGALTYPEAKSLRTTIGAQLNNKLSPEAATLEPALRKLYGAATEDLKNAIGNAGGQPALDAWQRANRINQVAQQRRDQLAKIVGVKGDAGDEQVFDRILQMARDKGASNESRLLQARKVAGPDAWNDFTSAFIRRLGADPKTGEFSADRFLTAVGEDNLSPVGRQIIFNSTGRGDLANSIENLRKVAKQFSEFYKMGNPSGTGGANFIATLLGGGAAGILGIPSAAVGAAGMWGQAKFWAAPANVDKMTRTLQARLAYQRNPNPTTKQRLALAGADLAKALQDQSETK